MAQEHSGHRQRMRERFAKQGLDGFAPHEVLELILFYAIPQRNVNPLAHALLERFGSLHGVLDANVEQLMQVDGVGEYAATLLSLFSKTSALLQQSRAGERPALNNRRDAQEYCQRLLGRLKQEHLYAICMDGQMRVIADALIARGSLKEVPAYPRIMADAALRFNAHSVVLCHNHPGCTAIPSQSDMDMTVRMGELLHAIEVVLVDHIIVAGDEVFSMMGHGLIQQDCSAAGIVTRVKSSAGEVRIGDGLAKRRTAQPKTAKEKE